MGGNLFFFKVFDFLKLFFFLECFLLDILVGRVVVFFGKVGLIVLVIFLEYKFIGGRIFFFRIFKCIL